MGFNLSVLWGFLLYLFRFQRFYNTKTEAVREGPGRAPEPLLHAPEGQNQRRPKPYGDARMLI
jgi:hypothetical protein